MRPWLLAPGALSVSAARLAIAAAVLAVAGAPGRSLAQGSFEATPYVGAWVPMGVVHEDAVNGELVRRSQVGDIMIGGRFGLAFAGGFGADLNFGLTPGMVARSDRSGTDDFPGLALVVNARVTRQMRLNREFDGHFAAGAGVVRRSGSGWNGPSVSPAALVGYGMETPLATNSAFRMEVEFLVSQGRRAALGGPPARGWRGDLMVTFGVLLPSRQRQASKGREK